MNNLKSNYLETVVPKLVDEFKYKNPHQIPKLVKIQINSGLGLNGQNRVFIQKATDEIMEAIRSGKFIYDLSK